MFKKKIVLAALAAFVAVSGFASDAVAARLVRESLKWANGLTETDKLPISGTFIDTTQAFVVEGWSVPPSVSTSDSLVLGWVVLESDTTGATNNLTAFNIKFLTAPFGGVASWGVSLAPGSQTATSGATSLVFPIWASIGGGIYRAAHSRGMPFAGRIRFVIDGDTGAMPAVRAYLLHWAD